MRCGTPLLPPKRKFCDDNCARYHKKNVKVPRGPNTGRSSDRAVLNYKQRKARGWTDEQLTLGFAVGRDKYAPARKLGYRSMFEVHLATQLEEAGVAYEYETVTLSYTLTKNYTPDFVLPNGILVEAKGYFDADARAKMKAVKEQHPDKDIRIVFQALSDKNERWAKRVGFEFAVKTIPEEWFR